MCRSVCAATPPGTFESGPGRIRPGSPHRAGSPVNPLAEGRGGTGPAADTARHVQKTAVRTRTPIRVSGGRRQRLARTGTGGVRHTPARYGRGRRVATRIGNARRRCPHPVKVRDPAGSVGWRWGGGSTRRCRRVGAADKGMDGREEWAEDRVWGRGGGACGRAAPVDAAGIAPADTSEKIRGPGWGGGRRSARLQACRRHRGHTPPDRRTPGSGKAGGSPYELHGYK